MTEFIARAARAGARREASPASRRARAARGLVAGARRARRSAAARGRSARRRFPSRGSSARRWPRSRATPGARRSSTAATWAAPRSSTRRCARAAIDALSRVHGHDRRGDPQGAPAAPSARSATARARWPSRASAISEPLGFNDSYALAVTRATATRLGLGTHLGSRAASRPAPRPHARVPRARRRLARPRARTTGSTCRTCAGHPARAGLRGARERRDRRHGHLHDRRPDRARSIWSCSRTTARSSRATTRCSSIDSTSPQRAPAALAAMRRLEGRDRRGADDPRQRARRAGEAAVRRRRAASSLASALGARSRGRGARRRAGRAAMLARHLLRSTSSSWRSSLARRDPARRAARRSLATRSPRARGASLLAAAGVLQTIPSLALLAFLIPLLGIGRGAGAGRALPLRPAAHRAEHLRRADDDRRPALVEAAEALGLSAARAQLLARRAADGLARRSWPGIKTSAVINVGTATLAALIGAGGLGEPILSGIQLRDTR